MGEFEGLDGLFSFLGKSRAPRSEDPKDYDRAVQVTDDRALLAVAALTRKMEEVAEAERLCQVLKAELEAMHARLFLDLGRLYPSVLGPIRGKNAGIRNWKNEVWYVGWDE